MPSPPRLAGATGAATPGVSDAVTRQITDAEFALFRKLVHREAGIHLGPMKKALLVGRLASRLRALGLTRFRDYYELVVSSDAELVEMLDRVCTNETHFFRDPRQFEFLRAVALPEWLRLAAAGARDRVVRVWSAACSTGEEPYSIAMLLHDELSARQPPWRIEITATDLSTRVLAQASEGVWRAAKGDEIPRALLRKYMLRGVRTQEGKIRIAPEIRALVQFERLNLAGDRRPIGRGFDAIFCRNVLIYFDAAMKKSVVTRLADCLSPRGFLFLGQSESLSGITDGLRSAGPAVYRPQLREA
ncbi:MAG TPA: protein-glutamate O-methyltransferase CheR [Thermoanaerobaculia bacterium]|nr:protein-glutamate O-methyltransferase CheR [Thermoanaerobaculia bacterium]